MSRIEAEWLVAYALWAQHVVTSYFLINETLLPMGREVLMKRCKKCGREYFSYCIQCAFRNSGEINETERHEPDLCDQMNSLITDPGYRIENALQWMQVQKDNNGNYCVDNCGWETRLQQANNKRGNRIVRVGSETKTLAEWSRHSGLHAMTIKNRLNAGWEPERAVTNRPRPIQHKTAMVQQSLL